MKTMTSSSDASGPVTSGDDTSHSLGTCRAKGCRRRVAVLTSGFQVPFCPAEWGRLSDGARRDLAEVAPASPFDVDAAAKAARAVQRALRELGGRTS
jgi:hypothetical protein